MKNRGILYQLILVVFSATFFVLSPIKSVWLNVLVYFVGAVGLSFLIGKILCKPIIHLKKRVQELKKQMKKFNQEIQVASSQVSAVSEQLSITLDENNTFAQQLFSETKGMNELNNEVNRKIKETIDGVKQAIVLMEESKNTSNELESISIASSEIIKTSLEEVMQIVTIIRCIQESSDGTMKYMKKLESTSKEIVQILETVSNVSKQTQMLSLNASIESARAGEAGKGFAVVADQIKNLALSTGESVKVIKQLIAHIQDEVENMSTAIDENADRVSGGVQATGRIEKYLGKINESFSKVLGMIQSINMVSEKEMGICNQIRCKAEEVEGIIGLSEKNMEELYDSVHKQKHNIEDIAGMSTRLNLAARDITGLLEGTEQEKEEIVKVDQNIIDHAISQFKNIYLKLAGVEGFFDLDKQAHSRFLNGLVNQNEFIEAAWTNDAKGRFIFSVPEAGIINAGVREWFKRSIHGDEYVSTPYVSAISRNLCVTISAPIWDRQGKISGVIGIDVKLS